MILVSLNLLTKTLDRGKYWRVVCASGAFAFILGNFSRTCSHGTVRFAIRFSVFIRLCVVLPTLKFIWFSLVNVYHM